MNLPFVLTVVLTLCLAATAATAQRLVCERTSITRGGFTRTSDLYRVFPERTEFEVRGDAAASRPYGQGTANKRGNRIVMQFRPVRDDPGVLVRVAYIPSSSRYVASLHLGARYVGGAGASGQCRQVR